MATLAENRYGKSLVRLARVRRGSSRNEFREWTVQVLFQGHFERCFAQGDNSQILPTDTIKNTVYFVACTSKADSIEAFAKELVDFLLGRNAQVTRADVTVSEKPWRPLEIAGQPHPTAFVQAGGELQTTTVNREQNAPFAVTSGIEDLVILKTADSAFEGYIHDSLTTLPETSDRLLGTSLRAHWAYVDDAADFNATRTAIRQLLLATFAAHQSKSVQHTLYAMGEAVLASVAGVREIELIMPNKHYLPVDLSRFGQHNANDIFLPTDEPHGYIEARIRR